MQDANPLEALIELAASGAERPTAQRLPHVQGLAAAVRDTSIVYGECARLLFPLLSVSGLLAARRARRCCGPCQPPSGLASGGGQASC